MNLDIQNWQSFRIGSLFRILNGKGITQEEIEENPGNLVAVQSGEENNGIIGYISIDYCQKMKYTYVNKPCLTVARTGTAGFVSFQHDGCVVGDSAKILLLPDGLSQVELYIFFQTILDKIRFKYAFGRKVTEYKYLNERIKLPVKHNADGSFVIDSNHTYSDEGYVPDWQFMVDYIRTLHYNPLKTNNKINQQLELKIAIWKNFEIDKLFPKIEKGKCGDASSLVEGDEINYIGAKYDGNGVIKSCSLNANLQYISKGNCIAMIGQGEGSAGYAIYLDEDFIGATSLNLGYADWINPTRAIFVVTLLCLEYDKYSFGRSWTGERLRKTTIKLPATPDGEPDWQFMEDYIKSLPYGDWMDK